MANCYAQPYESLNSTAQLIKLPKKSGQRSRSHGRSSVTFKNPMNLRFFNDSIWNKNETTSGRNQPTKKVNTTDNNVNKQISSAATKNSKSLHVNSSKPRPRPRTSISKSSISGSESSNTLNEIGVFDSTKLSNSSSKSKTTVTVHLSKTSSTSTPNLASRVLESESSKINGNRINKPNESPGRTIQSFTQNSSVGNRQMQNHATPTMKPLHEEEQSNNLALNSFQVFRQSRYRNRNKAENRIKHIEHLQQNGKCNEIVNGISKGMCPNVYENQQSLNLIDFVSKNNIITSSKSNLSQNHSLPNKSKFPSPQNTFLPNKSKFPQPQHTSLPNKFPPSNRNKTNTDHIYTEINEEHIPRPLSAPPILRKKVTFSTFHEPIQESSLPQNKKIFPAKFWGMVQVTQPLRSKTDEERRRIVYLCYHAIVSNAEDNSLRFLGKVQRDDSEKDVYLVLLENSFEIRNEQGLIIAKHKFSDISVVTQMEDPNVFAYVGRCKYNGRIGIAIRFNKTKHSSIIYNCFMTINR